MHTIMCKFCKKLFKSPRATQQYCSIECSHKASRRRNIIIECKNYAYLIIDSKKYGEKIFLIDIEDIEKISQFTWRIAFRKNTNNFYAIAHLNKNQNLRLHRFITNCPIDKVVDHINHNTLDNRKYNLRICTQRANTLNARLSKNNTSGLNGIRKSSNNKWVVTYCNRYIGSYVNLVEAKLARLKCEQKDNEHINYKII